MTLFRRCIKVVLKNEGGYQCDPNDPGNWTHAEMYNQYLEVRNTDKCTANRIIARAIKSKVLKGTNYGISARAFSQEDIVNLTPERAKQIYYKHYWLPMNLEGLVPDLLVLHLFDWGVNSGKRVPIRILQRMVGVKADGIIGPVTRAAVNNYEPVRVTEGGVAKIYPLSALFIERRKAWYINLANHRPELKKYLHGWIKRIEHTRFY